MIDRRESTEQVVITGTGIISPIGIGADAFLANMLAGKSGISHIEMMSFSAAPRNVGGEVKEFDDDSAKKTYLKAQRKSIKVMCREIQLGVASAALAIENAGVAIENVNHDRIGVDFGANLMFSPPDVLKDAAWSCVENGASERHFVFSKWGTTGLQTMEPLWLLKYLPNMPGCHIGIACDARGPNNSITLDEASGNLALGEATRVIQRGRADIMIAGTTGTRLHPVKTIHAALWDELADTTDPPAAWCRPFDRNRTGQVLAEGACSFIVETAGHAAGRGAQVLGTILGNGSSCVIDPQGGPNIRRAMANAMKAALRDAGLQPRDIGHINAHGLGSEKMDIEEALAIRDVFGELADKVPVTALKSYIGNSGSGCGTLELAGSLLSLGQGYILPTLNYETPDPQCRLNVVHGEPLATSNKVFLNLNATRVGQASALIVRVE
jgi:3-oxoacyl-[acyl-carrier-protein] synthase II